MSTAAHVAVRPAARPLPSGHTGLLDQLLVIASTMLNPRRVIAEVEQMAALHRRAASVEATDPLLAARLREQASRIGLR